MQRFKLAALAVSMAAILLGADWSSTSGNPQRDGWSRGETKLSKAGAKDIQLLYKFKFDNQPKGLQALTAPIIVERIVGWRGFKELLYIGASSDVVYSIDADLNRLYSTTKLDYKWADRVPQPGSTVPCPGGLTASQIGRAHV